MGIFRKASDLEQIPDSVKQAYFNNFETEIKDEFEGLLKEASANKNVYQSRLKAFNENSKEAYNFEKPAPARYSELEGGIRRVGEGKKFKDEESPFFNDRLRNINFDNDRYAENLLYSGASIFEPDFETLKDAFDESQKVDDKMFDRRTLAEKRASNHSAWEFEQSRNLRQAKVLPYRDYAIKRTGNETGSANNEFNSVNEFLAHSHDAIRQMSIEANNSRKKGIERQGYDPEEARYQWQNMESIEARTMRALQNNSPLLMQLAEKISLSNE